MGRAAVLQRLPDLHAGAREVLLERQKAVISHKDERMLWEFIDQPFTDGWMGVC